MSDWTGSGDASGAAVPSTLTPLQRAQAKLQLWSDAEDAVATGKSYSIGSRQLQRADLADIRKQIAFYEGEVERLTAGRGRGARVLRVIPRDL